MSNLLEVRDNQPVTITGFEGTISYILYVDNNARVYRRMGHLGDYAVHSPSDDPDGIPCEYLGGKPCIFFNRTTGIITDTQEIFEFLENGGK